MSRHATRTKQLHRESRWDRDRRVLAQAQRATPSSMALPVPAFEPEWTAAADAGQDHVHTFNWEAEYGSPLRPRLLQPEERPDLESASLRLLVNLTAEGSPTPPDLQDALLQELAELLAEAISEGIHRWHRSL